VIRPTATELVAEAILVAIKTGEADVVIPPTSFEAWRTVGRAMAPAFRVLAFFGIGCRELTALASRGIDHETHVSCYPEE